MRSKTIALVTAGLLGASALGACGGLPGGSTPDLPDLPPQICELLPNYGQGVPGCNLHL